MWNTFHRPTPPVTIREFVAFDCAQIIDDDIQHLIHTGDAGCPSFVLPHALGFDVVIYYADSSCKYEPTFDNSTLF